MSDERLDLGTAQGPLPTVLVKSCRTDLPIGTEKKAGKKDLKDYCKKGK